MDHEPRQPRLLLLTDSLHTGGRERRVVDLLKGLRRSGRFAAFLAVLDPGGGFAGGAAEHASALLPLRRRARFDVTPALALIGAVRRARIDLIQSMGWMSGLAGLVAGRWLRIPVVYANLVDQPFRLALRGRISRYCALQCDAAVANAAAARDAYGLSQHPTAVVIPNGVDLERFAGVSEPASTPTVCMVANFNPRKDHATVVRALPQVVRAFPQVQLVLVGRDAGTLRTVSRLAAELGVSEAVQIVTETIRPEPIIARSHVCVLSTPSEGTSNALLEYMASARPVVATACAGNAAVVRDGETGFLVPFGSPPALASKIIDLLDNPEQARVMGRAGRRRVEEHFYLERMVADYEALYDRVLASQRSSARRPRRRAAEE